MSREIKFRAWNDSSKKFVTTDFVIRNDGPYILTYDCHNGHMKSWSSPYDKFILQQYTGLKDKNGDEIYEGDIVKATSDQYENENFVGKVIFDEGCFLTWINKNDIRGIWGEDDIEVVGNIFENPELLK
jgi:uncharacterized phage protein (TIGR01671 family)